MFICCVQGGTLYGSSDTDEPLQVTPTIMLVHQRQTGLNPRSPRRSQVILNDCLRVCHYFSSDILIKSMILKVSENDQPIVRNTCFKAAFLIASADLLLIRRPLAIASVPDQIPSVCQTCYRLSVHSPVETTSESGCMWFHLFPYYFQFPFAFTVVIGIKVTERMCVYRFVPDIQ